MFTRARRLSAILVTLGLLLGSVPIAAAEPDPTVVPAPVTEPSSDSPTSPPTIHAEMLAEPPEFPTESMTLGAVPEPLAAPEGAIQGGESGGIASLPNGLTHEVYGYLPYWALDPSLRQYLRYDHVITIAYFSVAAQADGTLLRSGTGWTGWASANMTDVINRAHANGVGVHLTVTMMAWGGDYSAMTALLTSAPNRAALAADIASAVAARNADGVNLDFEPVPNSLESQYTTFVREVKAALVASGAGSYLTVAATGGAAAWDEGYDLAGLTAAGAADAIMVMGYDFSWSGSARAGGVAPIDSPYIFDVRDAMSTYLARVPANKLIWGVPYYGRAWTTQTGSVNSLTCKSAERVSDRQCSVGNRAQLGAALRRRARRHRQLRAPVGRQRPGPLVHVPQQHLQHPGAGLLRRRHLACGQVRDGGRQPDARRRHLAPAHGRRIVPSCGTSWRDSSATSPSSTSRYSAFVDDIVWLVASGITTGCGPNASARRHGDARADGQLPGPRPRAAGAATDDYFGDDAGSIHEADINRIAAGRHRRSDAQPTAFCPDTQVTRAQMASFLARALGLPAATRDYFSDDAGSMHEADINRVAEAGIAFGCGGRPLLPGRSRDPRADGRLPPPRRRPLTRRRRPMGPRRASTIGLSSGMPAAPVG